MLDSTLLQTAEHTFRVYHLELNHPLHPHSLAIICTWLTCGNILQVISIYPYKHVITGVSSVNIPLWSLHLFQNL